MKKTLSFIAKGIVATGSLTLPVVALAATSPYQQAQTKVQAVGQGAAIDTQGNLMLIIGNIINVALSFLGVLLLIYFLYAGFLWMTSDGKGTGVERAKSMMKNAVIGLVIVVAAYALSNFVLDQIITNVASS